MYLHFFGRFTMHHLTRWKANILSQAWETHPINEAFFHPLVSLAVVTAYQREQLAPNTNCQLEGRRGQFIHHSPPSFSSYSVVLRAEKGPSRNFRTSQRGSIRQSAALIAERVEFSTSFALRHDSCSWDGIRWVCLREVWWLKGCQRITSR